MAHGVETRLALLPFQPSLKCFHYQKKTKGSDCLLSVAILFRNSTNLSDAKTFGFPSSPVGLPVRRNNSGLFGRAALPISLLGLPLFPKASRGKSRQIELPGKSTRNVSRRDLLADCYTGLRSRDIAQFFPAISGRHCTS